MRPALASASPVLRSSRWPATVVDPMSTAIAEDPVVESRPRRNDLVVVPDGNGDVAALGQDCLDLSDHVEGSDEPGDVPFGVQGIAQEVQLAAGRVEMLCWHAGEVQANDRVDLHVRKVEPLADDLPVHLTLGRNIDHDVATISAWQPRRCSEEPSGRRPR